jgi:hypothetical protein
MKNKENVMTRSEVLEIIKQREKYCIHGNVSYERAVSEHPLDWDKVDDNVKRILVKPLSSYPLCVYISKE